jgi:drug/metabolite transporter (DMT)-like permease
VAPDARRGLLPAGDVLQFLLIGICGQVIAQLGIATGARLTLAANAALLALALPIMTALMAFIFLDERMTPVRWVSFVLAVAGVLVCAGIRWGELSITSTKYLLV